MYVLFASVVQLQIENVSKFLLVCIHYVLLISEEKSSNIVELSVLAGQ